MTMRVWQSTPGRWLATEPCIFRNGEWVTVDADKFPGAVLESMYAPNYIGKGTIWQRDVSNMPLAPNSDAMAKWMDDNSPTPWGKGAFGAKTGINTSALSSLP